MPSRKLVERISRATDIIQAAIDKHEALQPAAKVSPQA